MDFMLIKQYVFTAYKYQAPAQARGSCFFTTHTTSSAHLHPDLRAPLARAMAFSTLFCESWASLLRVPRMYTSNKDHNIGLSGP